MKFCNRCGDPVFGTRCRCGGTPKEAEGSGVGSSSDNTSNGASTQQRDVWSSKYLGRPLNETESSISGRATQKPDNNEPRCPRCDLRMSPTLGGEYACRVCSRRPSGTRGVCEACNKPVISMLRYTEPTTPGWVEYNERIWHKECFRCRVCQVRLTEPMVDLTGQPCCEDCLMAQAGAQPSMTDTLDATATITTTTTAPATTTRTNAAPLPSRAGVAVDRRAAGRDARRDNAANIDLNSEFDRKLAINMERKQSVDTEPKVLGVNNKPKPTETDAAQRVAVATGDLGIAPAANESSDSSNSVNAAEDRRGKRDSAGKYECYACGRQIKDAGVRLPSGRLYHPHCFTCTKCGEEFKQSAFVNYGGRAYHPECTPKVAVERCGACNKSINGFYVKNSGISFHAECFKCAGCATVIGPQTPFGEIAERPYCESCLRERITGNIFVPPNPAPPLPSTKSAVPASPPRSPNIDMDLSHHDSSAVSDIILDGGIWHSTTKAGIGIKESTVAALEGRTVTRPIAPAAQEASPRRSPMLPPQHLPAPSAERPRVSLASSDEDSRAAVALMRNNTVERRGTLSAAGLAAKEGVVGGARAYAHARSRSNTQNGNAANVNRMSMPVAGLASTAAARSASPHTGRPVSPRAGFEESLLSPSATSEFAVSRSSSRSSNASSWDYNRLPGFHAAGPARTTGDAPSVPPTATTANGTDAHRSDSPQTAAISKRVSRFGGTSLCFKCNERLYVSEEVPGPRATKWHRHCLVCVVCKKSLDSMAVMKDDDGPYCRMCSIKRARRATFV